MLSYVTYPQGAETCCFVLDSFSDDEFFGTENSVRRLNWQKGRQDWSRPSKTKAEIEKVTVDTMPEVYARMRKHGWAILRDCTEIFHPQARFTREQMTFIDKCKFTHLLQFVAIAT